MAKEMSEAAREAQREYHRKYRKTHKEQLKENRRRSIMQKFKGVSISLSNVSLPSGQAISSSLNRLETPPFVQSPKWLLYTSTLKQWIFIIFLSALVTSGAGK